MNTRRRLNVRLLPLILTALLLSACGDQDLKTVAKALDDSAHAIGVLQTTVIKAHQQKLLSEDITREILLAALKVDLAGKHAVDITRGISRLSPSDRTNLLAILRPVVEQLDHVEAEVLFNIKDPQTLQNVRAAFIVVSGILNAAQFTLAARN